MVPIALAISIYEIKICKLIKHTAYFIFYKLSRVIYNLVICIQPIDLKKNEVTQLLFMKENKGSRFRKLENLGRETPHKESIG